MLDYGFKLLMNTSALMGAIFYERGLKSTLQGFLDSLLHVSCGGLKMHQAWMVHSFTVGYVQRYPHLTKFCQATVITLRSTTSCEERFSTKNYINP